MVRDADAAGRMALLSELEKSLLGSPASPVVIAARHPDSPIPPDIAPGLETVGLLLPYTPIHFLVLERLGRPIVMTSGNRSGAPIAVTDADAKAHLGSIADAILTHDRAIVGPCDDSVVRVSGDRSLLIRRSRGYVPEPIALARSLDRPTLATGGQFKVASGLGFGRSVVLGAHTGDLDQLETYEAWVESLRRLEVLCDIQPERIVHDLHPDYASTRYAIERQRRFPELERVAVQHHHAHLAACMADNGLDGEVIGVCLDGVGHGPDGTAWGGELLVGGYRDVVRAAHLSARPMPGGDAVVREPWRMALSELRQAGWLERAGELVRDVPNHRIDQVASLLESSLASPVTTSMGRLFDAVAVLVLGRATASYEAELACQLEGLAEKSSDDGHYDLPENELDLDTGAVVSGVCGDVTKGARPETISRRFHNTLVLLCARACCRIASETGHARVVLSGGVFCNSIMSRELFDALRQRGLTPHVHRHIPPNDGGLALGQLAVASAGGGHRFASEGSL
jgi:hydrogenase maturation protein HypF